MKYKEGKSARRGSFQNCLADMLILADADNHEQFDELACLCCCGQSHRRRSGRGGGGREGLGGGAGRAGGVVEGLERCHFAFGLQGGGLGGGYL